MNLAGCPRRARLGQERQSSRGLSKWADRWGSLRTRESSRACPGPINPAVVQMDHETQGSPLWGGGVSSARRAQTGENAAVRAGAPSARPLSSVPVRWLRGELRMRAGQWLLRPRRRVWTRLQSAVLRQQQRSRAGAAGVGRVQVRSRHGAQTCGWTVSHVIEQAVVRCSRRIDGSSPAPLRSTSRRRARPHLGLAMPRASRSARTAVRSLRSVSAPRLRIVAE
jgi:hypothetical protein